MTDSNEMWFRQRPLTQARMPSMRPYPLNPRAPSIPAASAVAVAAAAPALAPPPAAPLPVRAAATPASRGRDSADKQAARAGGFHESSYELNSGLEISESEWPADVTVPGALGEH